MTGGPRRFTEKERPVRPRPVRGAVRNAGDGRPAAPDEKGRGLYVKEGLRLQDEGLGNRCLFLWACPQFTEA